jgi:hypothetical protein
MPELVRDDLRVHVRPQELTCVEVSEVVKSDPGQRRPLRQPAEGGAEQVGMDRAAVAPFDHEVRPLPFATQQQPALVLVDPYAPQEGHRGQCQGYREPRDDYRARLDPLDPVTGRHLGQCEFASETDPAVLRVILKVRDGAGGDYWWVECGSCDTAWQVPYYAESVE